MIFSIEHKDPSRVAIKSDTGVSLTYGQLCEYASEIGKVPKKRCLVFCLCRNVPGSVAGYVGFLSSNVVPLLLDAGINSEMLMGMRAVYRPAYFWAPMDMENELSDTEKVYEALDYVLLKTKDEAYEMNQNLCLLLTTSGSTGSPKLVRQSKKNVEANAHSIKEYLALDENERPITTLPMNYTYGLSIINSHLLSGATILMTECSVVQRDFWEFFKQEEATSFGGVPFTYEILKKIKFFTMKLPSLRYMTQAGGKLPTNLQGLFGKWAAENGKKFIIMYGQAEATARMGYLPAEKCLEKTGSMGIAIPGGKFSIIDGDGNEITEPEISGELVYRGENVTLGYAECAEDLKKGDERKGVLMTGDMAKFDADGYYYIVGRKKRFIKIYGVRVSLDECEQILKNRFSEGEFACVGQDDHMKIYTTAVDMGGDSAEYLSRALRLNQAAFEEIFMEKLPKNDAGKTLYKLLQEKDV